MKKAETMCIRKVFYCPDCNCYSKIPTAVTSPSLEFEILTYETPCGKSFCDCFNILFPWIERPFNRGELHHACTARCDFRTCQILPVVESCCKPSLRSRYRLVNVNSQQKYFRYQPAPNATHDNVNDDDDDDVTDEQTSQHDFPLPQMLSGKEMRTIVATHCTLDDTKKLYKGKSLSFEHESYQIKVIGMHRGYVTVQVNGDEGHQEFILSFGWLLYKTFWKDTEEKRRINLRSIFSVPESQT